MKTTRILLVLSLAPMMVGMSMAATPGNNPAVKAKVVDRFDKNGDGELSKRERKVATNHREKVVDRFDKNDDGKLGARERKVLQNVRSNKNSK